MIKRRKRPALTDIEVGSFSDIAFLLIIFFILTTQIVRLVGKTVEIPSGSESKQEEQKDDKKQLMVHMTGANKITINDETANLTLDDLKTRLIAEDFESKTKPEEKFVILDAQPDVPYEIYYKVVMMIDECGGKLAILEPEDTKKKGGS